MDFAPDTKHQLSDYNSNTVAEYGITRVQMYGEIHRMGGVDYDLKLGFSKKGTDISGHSLTETWKKMKQLALQI